jgi:hypothetical protein
MFQSFIKKEVCFRSIYTVRVLTYAVFAMLLVFISLLCGRFLGINSHSSLLLCTG